MITALPTGTTLTPVGSLSDPSDSIADYPYLYKPDPLGPMTGRPESFGMSYAQQPGPGQMMANNRLAHGLQQTMTVGGEKHLGPPPNRPLLPRTGYPPRALFDQGSIVQGGAQTQENGMDIVRSPPSQELPYHQFQASPSQQQASFLPRSTNGMPRDLYLSDPYPPIPYGYVPRTDATTLAMPATAPTVAVSSSSNLGDAQPGPEDLNAFQPFPTFEPIFEHSPTPSIAQEAPVVLPPLTVTDEGYYSLDKQPPMALNVTDENDDAHSVMTDGNLSDLSSDIKTRLELMFASELLEDCFPNG